MPLNFTLTALSYAVDLAAALATSRFLPLTSLVHPRQITIPPMPTYSRRNFGANRRLW